MLRICDLCRAVQAKNTSGRCGELRCNGTLSKAWLCTSCETPQAKSFFGGCGKKGCQGELKKLREIPSSSSSSIRPVVPEPNRFFPTASQLSKLEVEEEKTSQSSSSGDIRERLMQMHRNGPPKVVRPVFSQPQTVIEDAPKIVRSEIPDRTAKQRDHAADRRIAEQLMSSPEMRRIVVINMLAEYKPSAGARAALKLIEGSEALKQMTLSMTVVPTTAMEWNRLGATAFGQKCGACQQCVGIVFYKLLQEPLFSSPIRLIRVPGHHFVMFGDFNSTSPDSTTYIVDLWLQNLHRPDCKTLADLSEPSADWPVSVMRCDSPEAEWYVGYRSSWTCDLEYSPVIR